MITIPEDQINEEMKRVIAGNPPEWIPTRLNARDVELYDCVWVHQQDIGCRTQAKLLNACRKLQHSSYGNWCEVRTGWKQSGWGHRPIHDGVAVTVGMALRLRDMFCAREMAEELEAKRAAVYDNDIH